MARIVPTILALDAETFQEQLRKLSPLTKLLQIDVMDGKFVPDESFREVSIIKKMSIRNDCELHLMVNDPLTEMERWAELPNIRRVIFHIESSGEPGECINFARGKCWQIGIALNPATSLDVIKPWLNKIDLALFMTVVPGRQGAPFAPEVIEKIREFVRLPNHPLCAVDGGVNKDTIGALAAAGVEAFGVGSALTRASDVVAAYRELLNLIQA